MVANRIRNYQQSEIVEEVIDKNDKDEDNSRILLKILNKLLDDLKQKGTMKQVKDEFEKYLDQFDLSADIINLVHKNERFLRPLLDIVSENNVPKKEIKVLELNTSEAIMAEEVDKYLSSYAIYPIDVDYTLAVKAVDKVSDEFKNKSFKVIDWNPKTQSFPDNTLSLDLIVLRDSHQFVVIGCQTTVAGNARLVDRERILAVSLQMQSHRTRVGSQSADRQ